MGIGLFLLSCGGGYTGGGEGGNGGGGGDFALSWEAVSQGSALQLHWERVSSAEVYRVYVDGQLFDSTADTLYTLSTPCSLVEIEAAPLNLWASLDIAGKVVVSSVDDWGEVDSPYNPALGFSDGAAQTFPESDAANYGKFEALLDDGSSGVSASEIDFRSPTSYSLPYNSHANGFAPWPSGSDSAPPPSAYREVYPDYGGVQAGEYAVWLNPEGLDWDTLDHFVRVRVEEVSSDGRVRATFYYQTIGGLRWVPVN